MESRALYLPQAADDGTAAILHARRGGPVALRGVSIRVALCDLMCETEVTQRYQNDTHTNIEAVYTFPLPMDAVLLDVQVKLAAKTLRGCVIERKAAQTRYEDAITSGDSAVLLEQIGDGLYSMNLGNLLAGETAEIRLRYATWLTWHGDSLRVMIPTTLAPRYGVPRGLQPHEVPQHSLLVAYPLELVVDVGGVLADAALECASHAATIERSPAGARLRLAAGATLDRDFVLNVRAALAPPLATLYPDGAGLVALASLRPAFAARGEPGARCVKIVVDCSGSMNGDSIAQARAALHTLLAQLRPVDEFNIVAFGSTQKLLFPRPVTASADMLRRAAAFVDALAADMGGTELQTALERAMAMPGAVKSADILLITDGEVWEHHAIAAQATTTHHRIFVVGVGSAVAEAVVRELAAATNGACELVAPRENIAPAIERQFQRIYQPFALSTRIIWPGAPQWVQPWTLRAVFNGDTLHLMAGFATPVAGELVVEMRFADGEVTQQYIALTTAAASDRVAAAAPRLAAARRLQSLPENEARQLALQHQLLSPHTACFVLAERADKAQDLPQLSLTPHMLAAGWGGAGSVMAAAGEAYPPPVMRRTRTAPQKAAEPTYALEIHDSPLGDRKSGKARSAPQPLQPAAFAEKLNTYFGGFLNHTRCPAAIAQLAGLGLPDEIVAGLRYFCGQGWDEDLVVVGFLRLFAQHAGAGLLSRNAARVIAHAAKRLAPPAALLEPLAPCMDGLTAAEWNWVAPAGAPSTATREYAGSDDGRLEIPAFLRKQAD